MIRFVINPVTKWITISLRVTSVVHHTSQRKDADIH
jgi:hypothetical protein